MTREEAIARILDHMEAHCMGEYPHIKIKEALDLALAALRGPTREQVERMRGEWKLHGGGKNGRGGIWHCTRCERSYPYKCDFCPRCGAPMTDEAVDMMLERWKEIVNYEG